MILYDIILILLYDMILYYILYYIILYIITVIIIISLLFPNSKLCERVLVVIKRVGLRCTQAVAGRAQ